MIDRLSHTPIYLQIEKILTDKIATGELKPGDMLPSEAEMVKQYDVSRMTARKAVDYLVRQGSVERQRGRGTFVSQSSFEQQVELPLDHQLTSSQMTRFLTSPITNRLLHIEKVTVPLAISKELCIKADTPVWLIKRLRLINNIPFAYESSHMLFEPFFTDLTEDDLEGSKYAYIERKGYRVKDSKNKLVAKLPPKEVREYLGLNRDEPVLFSCCITSLEEHGKIEVSDIYYNQNHYTFTLETLM